MTDPGEGADAAPELTHLRQDGSAHMVDVTGKATTRRRAVAQAVLVTRPDVVAAVISGDLPKGEAVGTARVAGIMAAKQTSSLIPLCHPLPIGRIEIDIRGQDDRRAHLEPALREPGADDGTRAVLVLPRGGARGGDDHDRAAPRIHGGHARSQSPDLPPCFSRTSTSVTTARASTALTMS